LQRPADAVAAGLRAVAVFEQAGLTASIAETLALLSAQQAATGDHRTAVRSAERLVRIREADTVRADLHAVALLTLSSRLDQAGERDAATTAAKEAVRITDRLTVLNPAGHRHLHLEALHALADRLLVAENTGDAIQPLRDAVDLLKELTRTEPAHLPALAASAERLAGLERDHRQFDAAVGHLGRAVAAYRQLAEDDGRQVHAYARTSLLHGLWLQGEEQDQPGLDAIRTAVELYRQLHDGGDETVRSAYANALRELDNCRPRNRKEERRRARERAEELAPSR
jgi:hypothetical protein